MKLKTTIFSMLVCLLCFSFSASAQWCGIDTRDGNYQWKIETLATNTIKFTFHPIGAATGSDWVELVMHGGYGGHLMTLNTTSGDLEHTYTFPGVVPASIQFYFNYRIGAGGTHKNSVNEEYIIGTNCGGGGGAPNVEPEITLLPAMGGPFISPAEVMLRASATDEDGTITKVEFYNGAVKIGEILKADANGDNYNFVWENVQPGSYNITAKAIDDKFGTTTSDLATVTVTGDFTQEWCGESAGAAVPTTGNEFRWRAETAGDGKVTVTFRGIGGAAGSDWVSLLGYGDMNYSAATGNHTSVITGLVLNSPLSLSFVYRRGTATNNIGENNSNGNPITYAVGSQCAASTLPVNLIGFNSKTQPDGSISLNWATATESNNGYFLLERSADGKNFNELTKVYSKDGNSTSRLDYQFTDENPVSGNNYYKLSQFDNDGKSKELGLRVERGLLITQSSSIYPNPLKVSAFNVVLNEQINGPVSVSVSSLSGQEIYRNIVQASSGSLKVELPFKPSNGIYLVKVGENQTFKLLVE